MSATSSQRIAKNTVFLYMRMLFVMLINIFSVRYVLKGLGVVDYGVFNVVAGLVTMFHSLSGIISSATLRFYSYAIGEGKENEISKVFTASFNIFAILSLLILVLGEMLGIWFVNTQADIPIDRMQAANWVYQFTMLTFIIGLLTAPLSSLIFAYERMSVFAVISVIECVLKLLLAYCLVYLEFDHLILYGAGLLFIQIGVMAAYYVASRNGEGEYHYSRRVEKSLYKKMLTFSGWTLFSSSAGIGISQLVTMITNVFFGPIVNASRAIAFQMCSAMNSFTANIIVALRPPMIKQYAEGDYDKLNRFFCFSNKAVYYSLLIVLLPIFFEMETVLQLWLDIDDATTIRFCRLILIYVLILSLNNPISIIIQATGNIRAYSTYAEIPTLLCFPTTWILFAIGLQAEVAFYVMIVAIITSHIIRLKFLKKVFSIFSIKEYVYQFVFPSFLVTMIVVVFLALIKNGMHQSINRLLISFVTGWLFIILSSLLFGFTTYERRVLLSLVKHKK